MKNKRSVTRRMTARKRVPAAKLAGVERFADLALSLPKKKKEWKIRDFDGLEEAIAFTKRLGIPVPQQPKVDSIKWPGDKLPDLTYGELSRLMGQVTAIISYVSFVLKAAEAERDIWETKYVHALEQRIRQHEESGYTARNKDIREAMADSELDIKYRLKRFMRAAAMVKILEGLKMTHDNYYFTLKQEGDVRREPWARADK